MHGYRKLSVKSRNQKISHKVYTVLYNRHLEDDVNILQIVTSSLYPVLFPIKSCGQVKSLTMFEENYSSQLMETCCHSEKKKERTCTTQTTTTTIIIPPLGFLLRLILHQPIWTLNLLHTSHKIAHSRPSSLQKHIINITNNNNNTNHNIAIKILPICTLSITVVTILPQTL